MRYADAQRQFYAERAQQEAVDSLRNDRPSVETANAARPYTDAQTGLASLQQLAPSLKVIQDNRKADALYRMRTDFAREDGKLERLDPSYLDDKTKNNKIRFAQIKANYENEITARKAGYPPQVARLLNEASTPLEYRLELGKYVKSVQSGLYPHLQKVLSSGIPYRYPDGTVINADNPKLGEEQLADLINFHTLDYFTNKGIYGPNGDQGPTDDLLKEVGFGKAIEEAEHKVLQEKIKYTNEVAEYRTKKLAGDLIVSSIDSNQPIPIDTVLSMLQTTKKGTTNKDMTLGDSWDWLFKQVETIADAGDLGTAEKLLNQLDAHPKTGKLRILEAKATLYEKAKTGVDKHNAAAEFRKSVIESEFRLGRIDDNLLQKISGNSEITDAQGNKYNPEGVKFNWSAMIGDKAAASIGDNNDMIRQLRVNAMDPDQPLINPDSKEVAVMPEQVREVVKELWNKGNTFASINNAENKPIKEEHISVINATIEGAFPNWAKGLGADADVINMKKAARKHFLQLTRNAIGPNVDALAAMDQAIALVKDGLKDVNKGDPNGARKNRYYILGNAPYDGTTLGKRLRVGDFLSANLDKLGDIESLKTLDGYEEFKASFNSMPQSEINNLINFAQGDFVKVNKLSPAMELLYRRTGGKKHPIQVIWDNPSLISNSDRQRWAQTILTATGRKLETKESKLDAGLEKIKTACEADPKLRGAGEVFMSRVDFYLKNPTNVFAWTSLREHAIKCGADPELLNNLK